ncbi:MAG: L7Ae/L30e/S12e/Gadd45 family ribosomal protein [Eubacteriales bacterium]|jgi:ribosomal protein L7Ae-like RNA K-turn-binding protein
MDNNEKKLLSFLGIARKAGALTVGAQLSLAAVKDKKAKLLIVARDASDNTRADCEKAKKWKKLTLLTLFSKQELGSVVGKEEVSVAAVTSREFADNVKRLAQQISEGEPQQASQVNGGDANDKIQST